MKLTIILMTAGFLHLAARSVSQKITFTGKDVSLQTVFTSVKQQTGFVFFYQQELLDRCKPVTVSASQVSLSVFLDKVFLNQPVVYSIKNKNIIISAKSSLKDNNAVSFFAPLATPVKGYITDGDGNPLVGATITVKNSNTSTKTTGDGSFVINANAGDVLVMSFVGYDVKEIKLGASSVKNGMIGTIEMTISPTALRGVEVNKGYYTQKQIENTGNVFTVKGEDLRKQPVTDPILALQGRVPGLSISQTSGIPGAPMKIFLRGQNFIGAGFAATLNDPLYIVDGVPYSSAPQLEYMPIGNIISGSNLPGTSPGQVLSTTSGPSPFNMLNSADIETIDVLKDADATAIYGSRGANGVILITTRKAKAGRTRIDFNVSAGSSKQTVSPQLLNTQQYLEMRREAFKNDGIVPNENNYDINGFWDTSRYTNWTSELMGKTAIYSSALASVSGGTANTQFNVSVGYNKTGTYVPGDYSDQRISSHFSIAHNSENKKFHIDFSGSYSNDNSDLPSYESGYIAFAPDGPALYNKDGSLNWQTQGGAATWNNPVAYRFKHSQTNSNLLNSALSLRYTIIKGLEIKNTISYSTPQSIQINTNPATVVAPPYNTDPNNRVLTQSSTNGNTWNNETQINYHARIGKGNLDGLAGFSFQNTKANSIAFTAYGFSSDALITNPLSAPSFYLDYTNATQYKFSSVYGRVGYNWDQKYLLNVTLRNDGSSRFGPGKQFGTFGSIGAAWIFSNEVLAKRYMPWLSLGKLRASYGITGSDGIGNYLFLSRYDVSNSRYQGVTMLRPNSLSNPNLQWQQNVKFEAGLELGFLKDLINISIVYYQNKSDDQLVNFTLPQITGFGSVTRNLPALVRNAGWEFTLQTFNVRSANFSWTSAFNLSIPKNRILSYPDPYNTFYKVGNSLFSTDVYHYLGVDTQTGMYQFASKNASFITFDDLIFSKPITQLFYGGLNNTFSYKSWSMDLFFQFTKQNGYSWQKVFPMPGVGNEYSAPPNQPIEILKRWKKPGDISTIQLFSTGQATQLPINYYDVFRGSDAVVVDASFIRLKNVNLSYALPKSIIDRIHIQGVRVYFSGQNLFVITGYKVLDPETQNLLAPVKTFTAGINVTL